MTYQQVQDFQRGLDTRRSVFSAPPGSLRLCRNAHITRGGEVEKRKVMELRAELPAGTFGLHAIRDEIVVFGGATEPAELPASVRYQQLAHPNGAAMRRVLATQNFAGKPYVVAAYNDGAVYHFYDGARVTDWDEIAETMADSDAVAQALAVEVRAETLLATAVRGRTLTISGNEPGEDFPVTASTESTSTATLSATVVQEPVEPAEQEAAVARLVIEEDNANFEDNVSAVWVDGTLNLIEDTGPVFWGGSISGLTDGIAQAINNQDTHDYTAESLDGEVVITAPLEDGAAANGRTLSADVSSNLSVTLAENFAGGQDEVIGAVKIVDVEVGADFDQGATYRLEVQDADIPILGLAAGVGRTVLTFGDKMYSVAQSLLWFSGFTSGEPDPTAWTDNVTGAGFIDISTQEAGADTLTALGIYQNRLAVFARTGVQVWDMDADPANNQHVQTLQNIGTLAAESVLAFGDLDLFFLSESGVRSLRARDSSNVAGVNDVGTPVDNDVVEFLLGQPGNVRRRAVAALEPTSGRYWLAIGPRIYVFSRFPGSGISAWSTYELGDDRQVDHMAITSSQVFVRSGDQVFLYGGAGRQGYDDTEAEVWLPFLDGDDPGTLKTLQSVGAGCIGTWEVYLHPDPSRPDYSEYLGEISETTFGLDTQFPALGQSTHFGLRFITRSAFAARLASALLFYSSASQA